MAILILVAVLVVAPVSVLIGMNLGGAKAFENGAEDFTIKQYMDNLFEDYDETSLKTIQLENVQVDFFLTHLDETYYLVVYAQSDTSNRLEISQDLIVKGLMHTSPYDTWFFKVEDDEIVLSLELYTTQKQLLATRNVDINLVETKQRLEQRP